MSTPHTDSFPRIALWQYGPHKMMSGYPTWEPHCLAAQTYMRMAGVPFIEETCYNPQSSPINKLPVVAINDDKTIVFHDLFSKLNYLGYGLDTKRSAEVQAEISAWCSMITGSLYNIQQYNWFMEDLNFDSMIEAVYSKSLSFPLSWYLPRKYKQSVAEQMKVIGYSNSKYVYDHATTLYKALSTKLGDKQYFFGDECSTLDAVAFGFLATQLIPQLPNRQLHYLIIQHENLVNYVKRINSQFFDITKPIQLDLEPAQIWLKQVMRVESEKSRPTRPSAPTASLAIATAIGCTVLFMAAQSIPAHYYFAKAYNKFLIFRKDKDALAENERLKWFGPKPGEIQPGNPEDYDLFGAGQKRIMSSLRSEDDGDVYDWNEGYLEEMETGSDIPEDHVDLGDDVEDI